MSATVERRCASLLTREARGHGLVISVCSVAGIDPDALREAAVSKGRPPDG